MAVEVEPSETVGPAALARGESRIQRWLERATQVFLVVFVLAAPHSIAVVQGAFIAGSLLWIARMIAARRFLFARTPVDLPLAIFVGWTFLSVVTSLDPAYSLGRMRGVSLFFVLYLFATHVTTKRFAWALSLLLAVSVCGNLWWTYFERARGVGLEVTSMGASPLKKWTIRPGDTILEVDGRPVRDLASFNAAFDEGRGRDHTAIRFTRGEGDMTTTYRRSRVRRDGEGPERLAITVEPGRSYRSRAFFSHPATYAETLQLIGAVAVAWAICAAARRRWLWVVGMSALTVAIVGALIQTQTRAPIVAFGLAVVAMTLLRGASKRVLAGVAIGALVVVAVAGVVVLRGRTVSMLSPTDESTAWRLTVWSEGIDLIAKHPLLGIGPDAAKTQARDLQLYDNGKLPPGHFHSTPLQLAVDRGLPALVAWGVLLVVFFVAVARSVRRLASREADDDWRVTAAVLGAWGAWLGFVASSFVHFNWGDSEPMQMAWALMGIAFAVARIDRSDEVAAS